MKIISLVGLFAGLFVSILLTVVMPIPAGIPALFWLLSIFGSATAFLMLVEVLIILITATRE